MSDAGIRIDRKIGYTVVPNGILPEGLISARSWGLYVYLMSRPPGWECRVGHLKTVFTEGRDAIYTALRELCRVGLMAKETYRDSNGVPRSRYVLRDPESPNTDSQDAGRPNTDSQDAAFPNPENPGVVTTDKSTTTEGSQTPAKPAVSDALERFEEFWDAYGKKKSRGQAITAWKRALKKAEPEVIIAAALAHAQWHVKAGTEHQFIPHPTTWLNGERWADERSEAVSGKASTTDARVAEGVALAERLAAEATEPLRAVGGYR